MKTCTGCHQTLPELFFHADHCHRDGLASQCRACSTLSKAASKRRLAFVTGRKRSLHREAFELYPLQGLDT